MNAVHVPPRANGRFIGPSIVGPSEMASMQIGSKVRDELTAVAGGRFGGASPSEAVQRLVREHQFEQINRRYEELRADSHERANYQTEARLTDNVAGDGLPSAEEEYPEYNQRRTATGAVADLDCAGFPQKESWVKC